MLYLLRIHGKLGTGYQMPAIGTGVADLAELANISPAERWDKLSIFVESERQLYHYDAESTEIADGKTIILPADNPASGRWKVSVGEPYQQGILTGWDTTLTQTVTITDPGVDWAPFGVANYNTNVFTKKLSSTQFEISVSGLAATSTDSVFWFVVTK